MQIISLCPVDQAQDFFITIFVSAKHLPHHQRTISGTIFCHKTALKIGHGIGKQRNRTLFPRSQGKRTFLHLIFFMTVNRSEIQRFLCHFLRRIGNDKFFTFPDQFQRIGSVVDPQQEHGRLIGNQRHPANGHGIDPALCIFCQYQNHLFRIFSCPRFFNGTLFLHCKHSFFLPFSRKSTAKTHGNQIFFQKSGKNTCDWICKNNKGCYQ